MKRKPVWKPPFVAAITPPQSSQTTRSVDLIGKSVTVAMADWMTEEG